MSTLRAAWLIARKDLVIEARSRELVLTTLFFVDKPGDPRDAAHATAARR